MYVEAISMYQNLFIVGETILLIKLRILRDET
jgi:hypothetical protein